MSCREEEESECGQVLDPSPAAGKAAHLLFQGHNCVDSEVSTLAGISDTNRSREEEPCCQDLKAAPTGQRHFRLETSLFQHRNTAGSLELAHLCEESASVSSSVPSSPEVLPLLFGVFKRGGNRNLYQRSKQRQTCRRC